MFFIIISQYLIFIQKKIIYNDLIKFLFFTNFIDIKYFIIFKNNFIIYFKIYYIYYKNKIFIIFLRFKIYFEIRDFKIYRIRFDNKNKYIFNFF